MKQHHSQLQIRVHELGHLISNNLGLLQQPHTQSQLRLIFVTGGGGTHIVNGERHVIKMGCIYAALPGQKYQLIAEPDTSGFLLCVESGYLHNAITGFKISDETIIHYFFSRHSMLHVRYEQISGLYDAFVRLENELLSSFNLRTEIASTYLQILLLYIRREIEHVMQSEEAKQYNPILQNFMLLVEKNFREKKTIAEYAAELSVTPNYLNHIIKRTSGNSPGYHIRQRIMYEAKRKLLYSGASLKQISYDLGFYNPAHFSKLFKNTTGMNFTQFKKNNYNNLVI